MVPNVTQLNLALQTRIDVSINAVKGLLLNGTTATFSRIGFPNGTDITIINSETDNSKNTVNTTTNVESFIASFLTQWLRRNTSLSNGNPFPLCQDGSAFPIDHPLLAGETIELNYMDSLCLDLTEEVDNLVASGRATDSLLAHLENVKANRENIA